MNIGELLADKVATVPLLSTVLRVDITLHGSADARAQAINLLTSWIDERTEARELGFAWSDGSQTFANGKFSLDWAEDEESFAFALDRPDSRIPNERSWLIDVALRRIGGIAVLSTRLSVRQAKKTPLPVPGAPKFLSTIVNMVGAVDVIGLKNTWTRVDKADIDAFAGFLTSTGRTLPIIAISEDDRIGGLHVDPTYIANTLSGTAHVVILSSEASQAITDLHGKQYSVFWGAVRIYNPGFTFSSEPRAHKLWIDVEVDRLESFKRNGFSDALVRHNFAQVTAAFESLPLLAPRTVRRQLELAAANRTVLEAEEQSLAPHVEDDLFVSDTQEEEVLLGPIPSEEQASARRGPEEQERELAQKLMLQLQARAEVEDRQEQELQALRADNAELSRKLNEEVEMREEFERENIRLMSEIAIYTGKTGSLSQETLASKFLGAFADAFGSARNLIDSQASLQRDTTSMSVEIEHLREELANAKTARYNAETRLSISSNAEPESDEIATAEIELGDADSLVKLFSQPRSAAESVIITNQARKSFEETPYADRERMQQTLMLLRDVYLPMRLEENKLKRDELYKKLTRSITDSSLTYGPTATNITRGMSPDDHYQQTSDGRSIPCEKIRDKRSTFNRQDFLCIYFAWDEQSKKLYLKGFRHGDTPSAHT